MEFQVSRHCLHEEVLQDISSHFSELSKIGKSETESRLVTARGWGSVELREGGGVTTNGRRVLRRCDDKLLEWTVAMAALL